MLSSRSRSRRTSTASTTRPLLPSSLTLIAKLSQLYGIAQELIEIAYVRGGSVVLVVRIAEESRAVLTQRVAAVDDSALSKALGVNSTRSSAVEITRNVTRFKYEQASCTPGHWCTAGAVINCSVGFFNPNSDADRATACAQCPPHATTFALEATSIEQCICEQRYFDANLTLDGINCKTCFVGTGPRGTSCSGLSRVFAAPHAKLARSCPRNLTPLTHLHR